jgi:hypothetical protein
LKFFRFSKIEDRESIDFEQHTTTSGEAQKAEICTRFFPGDNTILWSGRSKAPEKYHQARAIYA